MYMGGGRLYRVGCSHDVLVLTRKVNIPFSSGSSTVMLCDVW